MNEAFPNTSRRWTVQRQDVDGFYGAFFESEFVDVLYHEDPSLEKVLADRKRAKRFKPKIFINDKLVDYYRLADKDIPKGYTRLNLQANGQTVELGLKIPPKDVLSLQSSDWSLSVSKDLRLAALVSLIKAGHLTMFDLVGYNYALSASGIFVGRDILGQFFRDNHKKRKHKIHENGLAFFQEFVNIVRPVQTTSLELKGTVTDGLMLICGWEQRLPWAFLIFVRVSTMLNAVLIPILENADAVAKYVGFLQNSEEMLQASFCRFGGGHWDIDSQVITFNWPKGRFTQLK